jgi:hypothetical protein
MEEHTVYCGGCDHDVRVLITAPPSEEGQATLHDSEVVCLEINDHCSGASCPLGAIPPEDMVHRLLRNGLPIEGLRSVRGLCPTCELENDLVLLGGGRAMCTTCGSSTQWSFKGAERH